MPRNRTTSPRTPKKSRSRIANGLLPGLIRYLKNRLGALPRLVRNLFAALYPRRIFFALLNINVPVYERQKHTYVTGASGTGKTELVKLMMYSLLRCKRNSHAAFVVLDPHRDMAQEVAAWKEFARKHRRKLVYLDAGLSNEHSFVLNPLQISDKTLLNINRTAHKLVEVFREIMANANLTNQMEALLLPCITVLLEQEEGTPTLLCLKRFMDDESNHDLVERGTRSRDPAVAEFFQTAFHSTSYKHTKAAIYSRLQRLLNSIPFRSMTCGESTVDFAGEVDRGAFVVFSLAKGIVGSDATDAFGRFVIATLQAHILRRAVQPKAARKPVHLVIDEFQNFISPSIAELLTESRKYRLYLTAAQQFIGQNMSPEFTRLILSNANVKMVGQNEYKTRSDFAREFGLPVEELEKLRRGEFAIGVGAYRPFRMRVPAYLVDTRHKMAEEEWQTIASEQLERYYRAHEREHTPLSETPTMSARTVKHQVARGQPVQPARHTAEHPALAFA